MQAQQERELRKQHVTTRHETQQVKADESFARRMQHQEQQVASFRVQEYHEAVRRQRDLEDMGGIPPNRQASHGCCSHGLNISSGDKRARLW